MTSRELHLSRVTSIERRTQSDDTVFACLWKRLTQFCKVKKLLSNPEENLRLLTNYSLLQVAMAHWLLAQKPFSIIAQISTQGQIFLEPRRDLFVN